MEDFEIDIGMNEELDDKPQLNLSQYIKPIFYLLVVGIISYSVYYFFFLGYQEVYISVEKDGVKMPTTISVINQKGELIKTIDTTDKISLKDGVYSIDLRLPSGYIIDETTRHINVSKNNTSFNVILIPQWVKDISSITISSPETGYKNRMIDIKIETNNLGSSKNISLSGTADFSNIKDRQISINEQKSTNTISILVDEKKKEMKGKLCITNTKICSNEIKFSIQEEPRIEVKFSNKNIKTNKGSYFNISFSFENKSQVDLENIQVLYESVRGIEDINAVIESIPTFTSRKNSNNSITIRGKIPLGYQGDEPIEIFFKLKNNIIDRVLDGVKIEIDSPKIDIAKNYNLDNVLAGKEVLKNIDIKNNTDEEVQIEEITIKNVKSLNSPEIFKEWISYNTITNLGVQESKSLNLKLNPSIRSIKDEYEFVLSLKTNAGTYDVKLNGKIDAINFKFSINLSKDKYNITFNNNNISNPVNEFLNIKNEGDVIFNIQSLNVTGPAICSRVTIGSLPQDKEIKPNIPLQLHFIIQNVQPSAVSGACNLEMSYIDPLTGEITKSTKPFYIEVSSIN